MRGLVHLLSITIIIYLYNVLMNEDEEEEELNKKNHQQQQTTIFKLFERL